MISSLMFYYVCLAIFSYGPLSAVAGTKIPNAFLDFMTIFKCLLYIILIPIVALLPDITYKIITKTIYLSPNDYLIKKYQLT